MFHVLIPRHTSLVAVLVSTAGIAAVISACGGTSSTSATTTATNAAAPGSATLDGYVANVCKATAAFETAARPTGGQQADPSATPGDPATRAAGLLTAANAYLAALKADDPPADLVDYNDQLVNEVQTAITDVGSGNFGGPGGARGGQNGTPFARPRTPGAIPGGTPFARPNGGTPGGGFAGARGGAGALGLFLRNLPTPPAADAAELDRLAAANTDCQSAGFSFATN
jgi:hypothetical protein